ncbi:MAG: acetate--CoA ligase family protein, partial [Actinomycetota bacterium]|nr:acetate--CoA ligase family protein [Actinomycetota bacterium]
VSPDILHKSDVGGIRINIADETSLARAYDEMLDGVRQRMPGAAVWGVHIQKMVPPGREVIIGVDRDPTFGPLLMFGLGGIYVEVLQDVTFRLCPVTHREAHEMLSEVRSFGLLRGARGQRPADLEALADILVRVSVLASETPEILELDLNPVIVGDVGQGAMAADVRIGIGGTA